MVTIDEICKILGGEYGLPENLLSNDTDVSNEEDVQEFLLDDPETRIEKRYQNGVLIGFAIRQRNKDRKVVRYIGKRASNQEFTEMLSATVGQVLAGKKE